MLFCCECSCSVFWHHGMWSYRNHGMRIDNNFSIQCHEGSHPTLQPWCLGESVALHELSEFTIAGFIHLLNIGLRLGAVFAYLAWDAFDTSGLFVLKPKIFHFFFSRIRIRACTSEIRPLALSVHGPCHRFQWHASNCISSHRSLSIGGRFSSRSPWSPKGLLCYGSALVETNHICKISAPYPELHSLRLGVG